jgi:hypothetical protein
MTKTIALVCLSLALIAAVGSAEERTWTDTTGRSMKAEFLRLEGTDVVFRKDGKEVTVPLSRLSPQDRDAVNALSEQGDSENPFEVEAVDNPFEVVAEDNPFEVEAVEKDSLESPPDEGEKRQRIVQRVWTDAQGRQLKAKFVRINGLNVVLNRAGRISMVPYYNLSQVDQDYVAELLKGRGEEDKVPPPSARSNEGDDTTGSSLGVGSGGSPGMLGSSGSFPGGMPGSTPGVRYPRGGLSSGGLSSGGMPSLPPMPSGMPGMPGGSSFPGGPPPSGYPGSSPSPGRGGSGYPGSLPGSMPSAGGYPGGSSSPPGMAGGSSPAMGTGSSFPGSSLPSYPSTPGGPPGSSSMMGSGSSAMGGPSGMPGMGGPYGGSAPPMPDLPRFEFVYTCTHCNKEFSEAQSKGKTHCPGCGVAWLNQGGTAGTFNKSAPNYNPQWSTSRSFWGTRALAKLIIAAIAFLFSVLGGGTAYSRWNKS